MEKNNKPSQIKDIKLFEEELTFHSHVFRQSNEWLGNRAILLGNKIEQFNKSPEFNESIVNQLEQERKHLNLKIQWESKEKMRLERNADLLNKAKQSDLFIKMAEKFSKKEETNNFPPPSGNPS